MLLNFFVLFLRVNRIDQKNCASKISSGTKILFIRRYAIFFIVQINIEWKRAKATKKVSYLELIAFGWP
jgi:hypothetical protein